MATSPELQTPWVYRTEEQKARQTCREICRRPLALILYLLFTLFPFLSGRPFSAILESFSCPFVISCISSSFEFPPDSSLFSKQFSFSPAPEFISFLLLLCRSLFFCCPLPFISDSVAPLMSLTVTPSACLQLFGCFASLYP